MVMSFVMCIFAFSHHQEVIKQEDLPLMLAEFLQSVWIRDLKQSAVAHEPAMSLRQHLQHTHTNMFVSLAWWGCSTDVYLFLY